MKKILLYIFTLTFSFSAIAGPDTDFLPHNDPEDHIDFASRILALKPNPGVTELSMLLVVENTVLDKESIVRIETKTSAFKAKSDSKYFSAPINFIVNLKEVRAAIKKIANRVGDNTSNAKFNFMLTHISTSQDTPNMPLLRPMLIEIDDFEDKLQSEINRRPFLSVFNLYGGGERQMEPTNPKKSAILFGFGIKFFRTFLKGTSW